MQETSKNRDLETLRAFAIIFVLAHHFRHFARDLLVGLSPSIDLWQGVDLFFVISGYLITKSLATVTDKHSRNLSWWPALKAFWVRRAFRLLPAAWLWMLIPIIMAALWSEHPLIGSVQTVARDALAAFTQTANLYWAYCIGTPNWGVLCSRPAVLGTYWSLSQEEQFYLLLPLVLLFTPRRALVPALLLAIGALLFLNRPGLTLGWYVRPDGLLWGVVIAQINEKNLIASLPKVFLRSRFRVILPGILIMILGAIPTLIPNGAAGLSAVGLISIVSALLVWLCVSGLNFSPSGALGKILSWLGSRSYALYLAHWPTYILVRIFFFPENTSGIAQIQTAVLFLLIWCVTIGCFAELTHRLIETPLRLYGRKIARRIENSEQATICQLITPKPTGADAT